jgi:hypothetical protein
MRYAIHLVLSFFCAIMVLSTDDARAFQTVIVGDQDRPWEEGGGSDRTSPRGIIPDFRQGFTDARSGNTPGGVIDFTTQPGWIAPLRIDPSVNIVESIRAQKGTMSVSVPVNNVKNLDTPDLVKAILGGTPDDALEVKGVNALGTLIIIDLGARFGVDRIRFYPRNTVQSSPQNPFQRDFLRGYELLLNDGTDKTLSDTGIPLWTLTDRNEINPNAVTDISIPLQYVRHIRLRSLTSIGFEIDEVEVYGRGFVPVATYLSDVFDVGDIAAWGTLTWVERVIGPVEQSRVFIRTKSGDTPTPLSYTRIVRNLGDEPFGIEVLRGDYEELPQYLQGPIKVGGQTVATADGYRLLDRSERDALAQRGAVYYQKGDLNQEVPFDKSGNPLTRTTYTVLPLEERGTIQDDSQHWSPWSEPYTVSGTSITSPGPRRYFQFEVRFESDGLEAARSLDFIGFGLSSPPVASSITAEVFPREVHAGQTTSFTYAVRPTIREGKDTGFDSFVIDTPVEIERINRIALLNPDGQTATEQVFEESLGSLSFPYQKGMFTIRSVSDTSFIVGFSRITNDGVILLISFDGMILRYGTTLTGRAFIDGTQEVAQPVTPGNVVTLGEGDLENQSSLSVRISLKRDLLTSLTITPSAITPNGDGKNDVADIHYNILDLTDPAPVSVDVYTLAGRLVRHLYGGRDVSGRYTHRWDGRDRVGRVVPPGMYVVRVEVKTDTVTETATGTVAVVY